MSKQTHTRLQEYFYKHDAHMLGEEQYRKSAVLLLLTEQAGQWQVVFEVRSKKLRRQPGEICFPGGRIDQGETPKQAAIRETVEELGLLSEQIEIMGALDYLVTHFKAIIYPFVGSIPANTILNPNEDEVEEVFYVPLDFFLVTEPELYYLDVQVTPEENFPLHLIPGGENYNWGGGANKIPEYFYRYQDYVIWGLTARILNHFAGLIKNGRRG